MREQVIIQLFILCVCLFSTSLSFFLSLSLSLFIVIKLKVGFEREAHVLWMGCDSSIYFRHKEEKGVGRENRGCVAGVEEGEDVRGYWRAKGQGTNEKDVKEKSGSACGFRAPMASSAKHAAAAVAAAAAPLGHLHDGSELRPKPLLLPGHTELC